MSSNQNPPRKTRPGYAWKNHKLYCFSPSDGVLVMTGWPKLRAWRKTPKGVGFFHCRPEVKLGNSPSAGRTRRALRPPVYTSTNDIAPAGGLDCLSSFAATFPTAIRNAISVFGSRQWSLARLAQLPGGLEMIETNPGLAFAIANSWVFKTNTHPARTAKRLLRLPRRKAAAWLGFPDSKHSVRMLGKVCPEACYAHLILNLRRALNGGLDSALMKVIKHLPVLNVDSLTAINSKTFLRGAAPQLLNELSTESPHPGCLGEWLELLKDTNRMLHRLGQPVPTQRIFSLKALRRRHGAVTREYNAYFGEENARGELDLDSPVPPPPLPGTDQVVPLTTVNAFVAEATAMNHCVLSYALSENSPVRNGVSHIYHVASSQPATLEISPHPSGGWRVVQLKARSNAAPSVEAQAIVRAWLKADRI